MHHANSLSKKAYIFLFALVFQILILATNATMAFVARPYDREKLRLKSSQSSSVQVTGEWRGFWTDPRKDITQDIRLNLEQNGDIVSGTIRSSEGTTFTIISGLVSGDQINILYDQKNAFRSRGATLLGTLRDGRLSGHYYAHDRPKPGWAAKGSWEATRKQD